MLINNELSNYQALEKIIELCNQFNKKSLLEVNKIAIDIIDYIVNKSPILNDILDEGRKRYPNCLEDFLNQYSSSEIAANPNLNLTFVSNIPGEIFVITTLLLAKFSSSENGKNISLKTFVSNYYSGKDLSQKFNNFKTNVMYQYLEVLKSMIGIIDDIDRLNSFLFDVEPVKPTVIPQYTQYVETETIEEKTVNILKNMVNDISIALKNDKRINDKKKYQIGSIIEEILFIFEKYKSFDAFCFAFLPLKLSLLKFKKYNGYIDQIERICFEYISKVPQKGDANIFDTVKNKARNYLKNFWYFYIKNFFY